MIPNKNRHPTILALVPITPVAGNRDKSLKEKTLLKFFLAHTTGNEEILSQANSGALLADCAEEAPTSCKKETGEKKTPAG